MTNDVNPTPEQIEKLMEATVTRKKVTLNAIQTAKLKQACINCYRDNPGATFGELKSASAVYLNFILSFPDLTLK